MFNANIVDHIGSQVTVWTKDGNAAENRQLHTVDEFGVVISNQDGKRTFIPWCQVKYVDYADKPDGYYATTEPEFVTMRELLSKFTNKELIEELKFRTPNFKEEIRICNNEVLEFFKGSIGAKFGKPNIIEGPATIFVYKH